MPLFLELLSMDEMFHGSKTPPIILNDLSSKTEEDREYFNSLVQDRYTTDVVSVMPQCNCGELKGEHLIGELCDNCSTTVRQSIEDDVAPTLWFRRPNNVERLINPIIWIMLDKRFTKSKYRILVWLTDRNYNPNIKRPLIIDEMIAAGIPRGYNSFVQNFDAIMTYLFNHNEFSVKKNASTGMFIDMLEITHPSGDPLQQLIAENRNRIFSDYIPVLNKSLVVLVQHATGIYIDNTFVGIKDTVNTMLSIDKDYYNKSPMSVENRTGKILMMLCDYYSNLFAKNLSPKEGLPRKHNYGTRTNMSFRAVITSHEAIHDHDEIWIPWGVGVTVFQLHILNRLMRPSKDSVGMTHNEALGLIYEHVHRYHPLLDQILKELLAGSPGGSIKCMHQRNPSLMAGSAILVRITKVKPDPGDQTVSMSDLVATSMNA